LDEGTILSGVEPDFLTQAEERQFDDLRRNNPALDDLERFVATNRERFSIHRRLKMAGG
jgi:hypothetical protein